MLNNTHIYKPVRRSLLFETATGILFWTVFILLGMYRLAKVSTLCLLDLFFRLSLTILIYSLLGLIIVTTIIVILSYYLITLPGTQVRLP